MSFTTLQPAQQERGSKMMTRSSRPLNRTWWARNKNSIRLASKSSLTNVTLNNIKKFLVTSVRHIELQNCLIAPPILLWKLHTQKRHLRDGSESHLQAAEMWKCKENNGLRWSPIQKNVTPCWCRQRINADSHHNTEWDLIDMFCRRNHWKSY